MEAPANLKGRMALRWMGFFILLAMTVGSPALGADVKIFSNQAPSITDEAAVQPWELGVKFQSAKAGKITAIRYYKAKSETGTHTGRLWSAAGTGLAQVTFTGETGSGWQQATLAEPFAIAAQTTYVITVNANTHFVTSPGGLVKSIANPPLSTVEDGVNGLYGPMGIFPTQTYQGNNYFRDLVFVQEEVTSLGRPLAASNPSGISVSIDVKGKFIRKTVMARSACGIRFLLRP